MVSELTGAKSAMQVRCFTLDFFQVNNYLVWCEETKDAVLIDSGGYLQDIVDFIAEKRLNFKFILNTHGHLDHAGGNDAFKKKLGVQVGIHKEDMFLIEMLEKQFEMFGLPVGTKVPEVDFFVADREIIRIGTIELEAIHTPGHTPGGLSYLNSQEKKIFVGDVLFKDSVGRTDLPGGSYQELKQSIEDKLFVLDPQTIVYSGHGDPTTIGYEKEYNPFFGNKALYQ